HVLVDDLGLVPGERVLLHGPNTPLFAASWFAIVKAGGIVVATMPLLRAGELAYTLDKARIRLALCHTACAEALDKAREQTDVLQARMATKADRFEAVDTAADDVVLIAFTSGTTGKAKATVHFHRDVLAICDAFPRSCMDVRPDDVFTGSPPLAFTFGLGG